MAWKKAKEHKPIILRGARQVGKTHLIRQFAKKFDSFVEINFEKHQSARAIFEKDLNIEQIIRNLELYTGKKITPGKTLLFLDEIQEVPRAIIALRYFYEECCELHVVAAGSLIEFAIESVGVPVGRVKFLYLYPMSFVEYLRAMGREMQVDHLTEHDPKQPLSPVIHHKLLGYVAEYMAIGGMPKVVKTWRDTKDIEMCASIQLDIVKSYQMDFEKYSKKHQIKYLSLIFDNIPQKIGKRFKFSKLPGEFRRRDLEPCFELLKKAQVIQPIYHTDAQGIPLGAQINQDCYKIIFIDMALAQRAMNMHPKDWFLQPETALANKGSLVESFVGQEILAYSRMEETPALYYWQRHQKSSQAEVDYILQLGQEILPIEVKSGQSGKLKSLNLFLETHPLSKYGVRISVNPFSQEKKLHSYPLYAIFKLFQ